MATLVEQLQQEALDPKVAVPHLLRRVKLIAAKLNLAAPAEWVDHELNGYPGEVPAYRRVSGAPKAHNPYNGWIPIDGSVEMMEAIRSRAVNQSISSLQALVDDTKSGGTLFFQFSPQQVEILSRGMPVSFPQMGLHVDRSTLVSILDSVRSKVLDWAIDLEREGILGTDVGFSPDEAKRARAVTIQIGSFNGNLSTGDASGPNSRFNLSSTDHSSNVNNETDLFAALLAAVQKINDDHEREVVVTAVTTMQKEQGLPGFVGAYQRFITTAANHMTIVAPFLPQLTALLGA